MNSYEFVFITKDGNKTLLDSTEKLISDFKGKVSTKDDWGKKNFAYKIKGLTEGHYHVWEVMLEPSQLIEIKNKLNLNEEIVRYLILKKDTK
ncbi:30S ribosomal protein S6 [Candidatus Roizmanbacteria bacterium RIFCSPLOWO2_02_FULL_37_19]|uniref:Small ribosomal subunit protein bS6 n=1 Tax=Candidatus Roizmanbacteria bacterium RIFCSPHIGHO2_02_FULL_37_24 TaxID=1802037 RepID=A0A1F7GYH1_9BACT|nr:MAG: 30S ribosomal protein S6 [Candidatus Roizmanbacteria bacterium RIFCSPHIGHO2_02_FULL_37_24]OGK33702.1 MAG: 30S ribosomal protein S6 [Candidatus Roizmanbacteria bacterium RIFCSPHIGHO2_12_FULL_37_23]OGK55158.1 MAG: 30S ribosomal protein S6 [Candidatus Roizmanbacteria bacterium RIFCSPLOWO2_02_FULL_37_19]